MNPYVTSTKTTQVTHEPATEGNEVKVVGISDSTTMLFGSYTQLDGKAANSNNVTVNSSELAAIFGGYSAYGDSHNNTLTINGSSVLSKASPSDGAFGAFVYSKGNATGNKVFISDDSKVKGKVYGARIFTSGDASDNHVTISNSSVGSNVYGAYASYGNVTDNHVTITDKSFVDSIVYGARSDSGTVSENTVTVSNGAKIDSNVIGGSAENKWDYSNAMNNRVYVTSATVDGTITGGYSINGVTSDNGVAITDSVCNGTVSGGRSGKGEASNNSLSIQNSTITGSVNGGYVEYSGNTTGNIISIEDSKINGTVYGGYTMNKANLDEHGYATGNTIVLRGKNNELDNTSIMGGYSQADKDATSNNTIVLDGFQGAVKTVQNIAGINVKGNDYDFSRPLLSFTGEGNDVSGIQITLDDEFVKAAAASGGNYTLFAAEDGGSVTGTDKVTLAPEATAPVREGIAYLYRVEMSGGSVTSTLHLNPQVKALSEGRIAALTFAHRAGNLVAEQGIQQATLAARGEKNIATFFSMSAGHDKVDSGSHVDADGIATMLGASTGLLKDKKLTLGGFVENGRGEYTTHNSFTNMPGVRGTGENTYTGAGVLLRYRLTSPCTNGFSLDASLRAGNQTTDFSSTDLHNGAGYHAAYELESTYLAGHLGASYELTLGRNVDAEVYARYLWAHLSSESANLGGDRFHFDSASSNRLRFGTRTTWQPCCRVQRYIGLAYEWECSGSARASVGNDRVAAPSMRGGSLIGEIGTSWQPWVQKPLWLNGGIQGSVGKTQGYGANLGCTIVF